MEAHLLLEPADREPRRVGGNDERRDLGFAGIGRPALGGDDVRAGLTGVRDEPLAAVDHPGATVGTVLESRGRPGPARIRARARFGQAVAAEHAAGRHRLEVALASGRASRPGGAARSRGSCGPRRSARASPRPGRSPRSRSRRRAYRGRPRLRPRGSGCRASPSRRAGARRRPGTGGPARARRRAADLGEHEFADGVPQQRLLGDRSRSTSPAYIADRWHRTARNTSGCDSTRPDTVLAFPACREPSAPTCERLVDTRGRAGPNGHHPRRRFVGTSSCCSASSDRRRRISSPHGSGPAEPASSSSFARSRPPSSWCAGRNATGSVARVTCTT